MEDQPAQNVTSLEDADRSRLNDQRALVERYLGDDSSRENYKTAAGKLGTIKAILEGNVFKPDQIYELQCLGVVLGDAFELNLGMEWVMVEDEQGRDPAVRLPGTTLILFPLTVISKRVERGEKVDIVELFNRIAVDVDTVRKRGG